jgi:flagellar hook assembly protein FlgD
VKIYPNPFIIEQNYVLTIEGLAENSSVKIVDINGRLVKQLDRNEIFGENAIWDGKDDKGNFVPSGIYIVLTYSRDKKKTTKVAVIR